MVASGLRGDIFQEDLNRDWDGLPDTVNHELWPCNLGKRENDPIKRLSRRSLDLIGVVYYRDQEF